MDDRSLDDVGMLLTGWCGALVLFGYGQAGVLPRRRLASLALGAGLLILAHLMDSDRRLATRYHAVVTAGRRLFDRVTG